MPLGYVVVLLDVHDTERYLEYARAASAIEAKYGGRALVAGDAVEVVEGTWPAERTVVLQFPSVEAARAWYADPEYQALLPLRHDATDSRILFIEGFDPPA